MSDKNEELFRLSAEELTTIRFLLDWTSRLEKELTVVRNNLQNCMTGINKKYSEEGKYELSNSITDEGVGTRKLIKESE